MKKRISILVVLFLSAFFSYSQSNVNLIVFSEDGDAFYVFVNGVKQNNIPETNLKMSNISPNISLRIEFENKSLPQLKQTMALEPNFEHTARIKRDAKNQLKLRYFGSVPLNESTVTVKEVQYNTAENSTSEEPKTGDGYSYNNNSSSTVTQSNSGNTSPTNVSINISMPDINMTVNANDPNATRTDASHSKTTRNSSASSTYNRGHHSGSGHDSEAKKHNNTNSNIKTNTNKNFSYGCRAAMSQANFNKIKEAVESKPFSDTKMSTAKVATKNACLSVDQIKVITKLFSMDGDKLTYAKYAYDYCVDKSNYYQVGEVFSFSTTTEELNAFLTK
ncbi:DUF4476 domain-containing protein [Aurantibacillus circumpalustris]|uniref:DUF4476 domain-containing protein n=1 Tax=Aurantibacillus circumpalustris TaxID=3036359 RepID=UPI00295BED52|nr:DUF4476 domain-containing protein [Aurantibacillus circumpalustris]